MGPKVWAVHSDFLPKNTAWKGGRERSNFIVEKLDKGSLARLSRSIPIAINHVDYMYA